MSLVYCKSHNRVSSRIFCLGGKNSLESLTTPTFVGTLYWHVINLFCTVLDRIIAASDEEKRRNHEVIKTLIRSLYFLVKHRVPHTTTFNDLISLQADNGNEIIKQHLSMCAGNAT